MTDDRRRAQSPAPPWTEPDPRQTLPYAATVASPKAQGLHPHRVVGPAAPQGTPPPPAELAQASVPPARAPERGPELAQASVPPARGPAAQELALAATTPRLEGATLDMQPPSKRGGSRRGSRQSDSPHTLDATLELPAADRAGEPLRLEPGQKIGHFVIRKRLGEGGMGVVLACHDADLGRPAAIKLLKAEVDLPQYRARLLREAQAMARLEHPNVVRVYEVGSERGRLFVAMELVDGVTLTEWLAGGRRPWREVLGVFTQVGDGLAAAHRAGLIHRDFKPDNVLVDRGGCARVADFGLARIVPDVAARGTAAPALGVSLTRSGVMMGTPGYMAPEQQAGSKVDARADQYSYCIALREALLGGRIVRLDAATWRHVPGALRAIVERGLSLEPEERFASMDELLAALRRVERRRRAAVSVAIAALAIAGGIATTAILMTRDREPARAPQPAGGGAPAEVQPRVQPAPPGAPGPGAAPQPGR
jgi:eukaryotic-like serine/threonine-protein kinase